MADLVFLECDTCITPRGCSKRKRCWRDIEREEAERLARLGVPAGWREQTEQIRLELVAALANASRLVEELTALKNGIASARMSAERDEAAAGALVKLRARVQGVIDAYGDKGWAQSEMCRRLASALEEAKHG